MEKGAKKLEHNIEIYANIENQLSFFANQIKDEVCFVLNTTHVKFMKVQSTGQAAQ